MKTQYFLFAGLLILLLAGRASAQTEPVKFTGPWEFNAGPMLTVPMWSFSSFNSVGFGVDASAHRPVSVLENLYVGGRVYAMHVLKKNGPTGFIFDYLYKPATLIGIVADAQYRYQQKYIVGGNIGFGLRFPEYFGSTGLARSVYVGYQMPLGSKALTIDLNLNRTTFASWNLGLRGSFRL